MRKDIFVVVIRILGVTHLVTAIFIFANLVSEWIGYIKPQGYSHEHNLINFGLNFIVGLYFTLRPYHLFNLFELFTGNDDNDQINNSEANEIESEVK